MLGNIHAESGIIADIDERSGGGGYGLVQWTPKSKLTEWAANRGLDHKKLKSQCKRIQWELENSQQFYSTATHPYTFKEFTKSKKDPVYLAKVFLHNYERPFDLNQPHRGDYATGWYDFLVVRGENGSTNNASNTSNANSNTSNTYIVKKGDTLYAIAQKFNTTVAKLQTLNNIKDVNKLSIGQVLKLK